MGTADRREEVLRLLRRRGDWTTEELAEALEVSRRTVLRDVEHLRERGFDITGMSGPGGGLHLEATSVAITSRLDAGEILALILAVGVAEAISRTPFSAAARSALNKIEASLPVARVDELQRLMQRVLVDVSPVSDSVDGRAIDPSLVELFETAFTGSRLMSFSYIDRHGTQTTRVVEPHGLLVRAPLWYVIAWDPQREGTRLFRADRIRTPAISETTFNPRPHELVTRICPDAKPAVA